MPNKNGPKLQQKLQFAQRTIGVLVCPRGLKFCMAPGPNLSKSGPGLRFRFFHVLKPRFQCRDGLWPVREKKNLNHGAPVPIQQQQHVRPGPTCPSDMELVISTCLNPEFACPGAFGRLFFRTLPLALKYANCPENSVRCEFVAQSAQEW